MKRINEDRDKDIGEENKEKKKLKPEFPRCWQDSFIICGLENGKIGIWNIDSQQCVKTLQGHKGPVSAIDTGDNEDIIVSGSHDYNVKVWQLQYDHVKILQGHSENITNVQLRYSDRIVVSAALDKTIRFWNIQSKDCLSMLKHHGMVYMTQSTDKKYLVSISGQDIKLWSGYECVKTIIHSDHFIDDYVIGDKRATSSYCKYKWDRIDNVAISPKSKYIVYNKGKGIFIYSLESDCGIKVINKYLFPRKFIIPNEKHIIFLSDRDNQIQMISLKSGRFIKAISDNKSHIQTILPIFNCKYIVSGSTGGLVNVWEVETNKCVRTFNTGSTVNCLTFKKCYKF